MVTYTDIPVDIGSSGRIEGLLRLELLGLGLEVGDVMWWFTSHPATITYLPWRDIVAWGQQARKT